MNFLCQHNAHSNACFVCAWIYLVFKQTAKTFKVAVKISLSTVWYFSLLPEFSYTRQHSYGALQVEREMLKSKSLNLLSIIKNKISFFKSTLYYTK